MHHDQDALQNSFGLILRESDWGATKIKPCNGILVVRLDAQYVGVFHPPVAETRDRRAIPRGWRFMDGHEWSKLYSTACPTRYLGVGQWGIIPRLTLRHETPVHMGLDAQVLKAVLDVDLIERACVAQGVG